jgi:hypothetical protein
MISPQVQPTLELRSDAVPYARDPKPDTGITKCPQEWRTMASPMLPNAPVEVTRPTEIMPRLTIRPIEMQ